MTCVIAVGPILLQIGDWTVVTLMAGKVDELKSIVVAY